ncbi:MAG TPA: DUF4252 domain-containing protein [bacterium]
MRFLKTIALTALGFVWFSQTARGQVDELRGEPGYVDLEWVTIPSDADRVTDVTLGPRIIGMVKQAEDRLLARRERQENQRRDLEQKLVSLQVKSFGVDSQLALKIRPMMERLERNLSRENWTPVIRVKVNQQITNVSVKYGDGRRVMGVFVMRLDPGREASFVNLIGEVELDQMRTMVVDVNQDAMDSLRKALETHRKTLEIEKFKRTK